MSSSKDCSVYKREKEILKIKTEKNVTYQEAKQQFTTSGNNLLSGQKTYANVAKRSFTHSETQTHLTWKEGNDNFTKLSVETSDRVITPSPKIIKQIEKMRAQTSQSSQTQHPPGQPTSKQANSSNKNSSSKPVNQSSSKSSSVQQKNVQKTNKNKQKQNGDQVEKMDSSEVLSSENHYSCLATETIFGDPMDTLPDKTRDKSRSPGRGRSPTVRKISPIRLST